MAKNNKKTSMKHPVKPAKKAPEKMVKHNHSKSLPAKADAKGAKQNPHSSASKHGKHQSNVSSKGPKAPGLLKKAPQHESKHESKNDQKTSMKDSAKVQNLKAPVKSDKLAKKDKKKKGKQDEVELEDDFVADDDFGPNEIAEYEAELAEVEESEEAQTEVSETTEAVWGETPVAASDRDEEIVLTDAEGRRYCRVRDCDQVANVDAYCRYHYLLLWKKIQVRKKILADGKLERYVEELTSRYPDKFLEVIRRDLRTEKDFLVAIQELEIDDSGADNDFEEDAQSYIDEVRGISEGSATTSDDDEF